ncbi:hypothetical protein ACQPW1_39550 [Nocardia sp. CA-128927]|uniref:hypothetical protein n=1 Tax=Nocardia sp. CA-128927 TaxID=3239975 RepID=UPI003D995CDA
MIAIDEPASPTWGFAELLADLARNKHSTGDPRWLAPLPGRARVGGTRYRRAAALLAVVSVLGGGAFLALDSDGATAEASSTASSVQTPPARPPASLVLTGNAYERCGPDAEPGAAWQRPEGGHQAIMAFEYAYYVARDAGQARGVVAADAAVPHEDQIQAGIDSVPAGTTYCARIQALTVGQYLLELTECRPGEPETSWRQRISTIELDGHAVIISIAAA